MPGVIGKFGLGVQNKAGQRLKEFCQENALIVASTLFQQQKRKFYTWTSSDGQYKNQIDCIFCSQRCRSSIGWVQFSHSVVSNSLRLHEPQHTRPPCPSPTPWVHPNPCPLSRWCHPGDASCLQSFPASESFQMSQLFSSGGQSTGVSATTPVFPKSTQDWSHLGWISLQSKGLSRVFSNTTVQNHQFFGAQLSL